MRTPDALAVAAYCKEIARGGDNESACKAAIIALERDYRERAEYWIMQVVEIEARKPPRVFIPVDSPLLDAIKRGDFSVD